MDIYQLLEKLDGEIVSNKAMVVIDEERIEIGGIVDNEFQLNERGKALAETHKAKAPSSTTDSTQKPKRARNEDGTLRVLSKFIPKTKNEITKDILYTMDINCSEKTFRDIAVGAEKFNEFENINANWKYPNGDKLLVGLINQVCNFKK